MRAALLTEYAVCPGAATWPSCDAMLTITPPPAAAISGIVYLHIRNALVRLAVRVRFQSANSSATTFSRGVVVAALLTRR
jgi:hypothetical protein